MAKRYTVLCNDVDIGVTDLEGRDPSMGVSFGRLLINDAYKQLAAKHIALTADADVRTAAGLVLTLIDNTSGALIVANWIAVQDARAQVGDDDDGDVEVTVQGADALVPLSVRWEHHADEWIAWAREPGHDSYWRFHRDAFFKIVPPPGKLTLDVGCGEGRVTRDLKERGHRVVAIDASASMVAAAQAADPSGDYRCANAAKLPLADESADLVVSFMVLHDVDDLDAVVAECARVLVHGGRLCAAIVHPINSAGSFATDAADSAFVMRDPYLVERRTEDTCTRDGLTMTFHSMHRTLETYSRALEKAGFAIEALREPPAHENRAMSDRAKRWLRVPLFLHVLSRRS